MSGKYGLIDSDGNTVADFVYDTIEPLFQGGKVNAYKVIQGYAENNDAKYGLLDKYGKIIKQLDETEPQVLYEDYKLIERKQCGKCIQFKELSAPQIIAVQMKVSLGAMT